MDVPFPMMVVLIVFVFFFLPALEVAPERAVDTGCALMKRASRRRMARRRATTSTATQESAMVVMLALMLGQQQQSNVASFTELLEDDVAEKTVAAEETVAEAEAAPLPRWENEALSAEGEGGLQALDEASAAFVRRSAAALREGGLWSPIAEGSGGVYKLEEGGRPLAVFKPESEEAGADAPRPLREGFASGEGALREVAAFRLDAANGALAGVPPTALVRPGASELLAGKGRGSMQQFVPHDSSADDCGTSLFDTESVHSIALLDVRLLNTDRHGANLLVLPAEQSTAAGKRKLVPIDHGLALPPAHALGEANFEWLFWRQAKAPLSAEAARWVRGLDAGRDAEMLRQLGLPEASVATMQLTTALLQRGVAAGWSLHEIGMFCQRGGWGDDPAPLEEMVAAAAVRSGVALRQISAPEHSAALVAAFDALLERHLRDDCAADDEPRKALPEAAGRGCRASTAAPLALSSSARQPVAAW